MHQISEDLESYNHWRLPEVDPALLANPHIRSFKSRYKVDDEFIGRHLLKFRKWADQLSLCDACKGLDGCTQPLTGAMKNLSVDEGGNLEENFESCRFIKEQDKKYEYRNNYIYSTLDQNDYSVTLSSLLANDQVVAENKEYFSALSNMIRNFHTSKGKYLYGAVGSGKTYLLTAAANEAASQGYSVVFASLPIFMNEYRLTSDEPAYRRKMLNWLKHCDVLFLDDVGAEYQSAYNRDEILLPLLEYRMVHKKRTYFSTNYSLEALTKIYELSGGSNNKIGALRLVDRIRALSEVLYVPGVSRRF